MQYVSKPTVIEAVQWTGTQESLAAVIGFCGNKCRQSGYDGSDRDRGDDMSHIKVELLAGRDGSTGWVPVSVGHWIAHWANDDGDMWPVDPASFEAKYVTSEHGDEEEGYTLGDLRDLGLLWLFNLTCLHPRGFAIGVAPDGSDWKLYGDGSEPWSYLTKEIVEIAIRAGAHPDKMPPYPIDDGAAFLALEQFLDRHRLSPVRG